MSAHDPSRSGRGCDETPDERLSLAVGQFNAGLWYDCHETLEDLWREEARPLRDLYKGVLQIAVGIFHERRANRKGAIRLLDSGLRLVEPFGETCLGLDVAGLRVSAGAALATLRAMEREGRGEPGLPDEHIPRLRLAAPGEGRSG